MVRTAYDMVVKIIGLPLCVGISCGVISVLVDLDHPISLALGWEISTARFLHPYSLALACVVIICCCAYIGRLLYRNVLNK